jgi:hypothetical protein
MIASSGTVLSNLAYLIGAVVVAVILGLLVWLRHRAPKSVDANMASFRRGLSVLAPDPRSSVRPMPSGRASRVRPALTHVRLEPAPRPAHFRAGGPSGDNGGSQSGEDHTAAEEAGGDGLGAGSG